MVVAKRPDWVPDRFEWWLGEPFSKCRFTFREAGTGDVAQVRRLLATAGLRASARRVLRWVTQYSYTVRLVCRNGRTAVGVCVSMHTPAETTVLALVVSSNYFDQANIPARLLFLAVGELPDVEAVMRVPPSDPLCAFLRGAGWRMVRCDETTDVAEFRFGPLLQRSNPAGGAKGRKPIPPPADG